MFEKKYTLQEIRTAITKASAKCFKDYENAKEDKDDSGLLALFTMLVTYNMGAYIIKELKGENDDE